MTLSTKLRDQTAAFVTAFQEVSGAGEFRTAAKTSALELIRIADYLTRDELTTINHKIDQNNAASQDLKNTFRQFRSSYLRTHGRDRNRR